MVVKRGQLFRITGTSLNPMTPTPGLVFCRLVEVLARAQKFTLEI